MKATDFNLSEEVVFSPDTGIVRFCNTRLLLFDADALGLLPMLNGYFSTFLQASRVPVV